MSYSYDLCGPARGWAHRHPTHVQRGPASQDKWHRSLFSAKPTPVPGGSRNGFGGADMCVGSRSAARSAPECVSPGHLTRVKLVEGPGCLGGGNILENNSTRCAQRCGPSRGEGWRDGASAGLSLLTTGLTPISHILGVDLRGRRTGSTSS